jgi:hypothetical protein
MQDDFVKVWKVAGLDKKKVEGKDIQFLTNMLLKDTTATSTKLCLLFTPIVCMV